VSPATQPRSPVGDPWGVPAPRPPVRPRCVTRLNSLGRSAPPAGVRRGRRAVQPAGRLTSVSLAALTPILCASVVSVAFDPDRELKRRDTPATGPTLPSYNAPRTSPRQLEQERGELQQLSTLPDHLASRRSARSASFSNGPLASARRRFARAPATHASIRSHASRCVCFIACCAIEMTFQQVSQRVKSACSLRLRALAVRSSQATSRSETRVVQSKNEPSDSVRRRWKSLASLCHGVMPKNCRAGKNTIHH